MDLKPKDTVVETYEDPPPAYEDIDNDDYDDSSSESSDDESLESHRPSSGGITLPLVIPQMTKHWKGAFFSPFVRAYAPELEAHGISQADFLSFIDGLNEAWVANPVFEGVGIAGRILGMVYGVQVVQWVGLGLEVSAGVASAATSYMRTRMYVKAMNKDLFHPVGLSLNILTTKKLMEQVKYPEDKLQFPPLEWSSDLDSNSALKSKQIAIKAAQESEQEDPRMRRLKALEGYVTPINMDVPAAAAPDEMLKKMGAAQARRMERNQKRRMTKRRVKGERKFVKKTRKAKRMQAKGDMRLERFESALEEHKTELDRQLSATEDPKQQKAAVKDFEKKEKKLQRKIEKSVAKTERKVAKKEAQAGKKRNRLDKREQKTAHKVRWIVISPRNKEQDSEEDYLSPSDSEEEEAMNMQMPEEQMPGEQMPAELHG